MNILILAFSLSLLVPHLSTAMPALKASDTALMARQSNGPWVEFCTASEYVIPVKNLPAWEPLSVVPILITIAAAFGTTSSIFTILEYVRCTIRSRGMESRLPR